MEYLWTPWRYAYITTTDQPVDCFLCAAAKSTDDRALLVVHRGEHNLVILNRFPYTSGHLMIAPYEHVASLESLSDPALFEMIRLARLSESHLRTIYRPDGLNMGVNIGRSAGAGVPTHIHMHMLPRWTGDTNFMSVVSDTRILPEDLSVTWEKLRAAFVAQTM
jgi:ATP adenylyltransferase